MRWKKQSDGTAPRWYLSDRPIKSAEDDRLGGASLAKTLAEAIASAEPPCMIGLMGGFGSGKSSVAALASSQHGLAGSFDCVTVSADKHSGNERARNLVHAIAAELQEFHGIKPAEVGNLLRPLRQSTQVTALDPTDTAWSRMRSGRYSFKEWLSAFLPPLFIAAVLAVLALLFGGAVEKVASAAAVATLPMWVVGLLLSDWAAAVKALGAGAELTDHLPRAEAADEIEEVFGELVELHKNKRGGRRLVVFVDDIDRLSEDDLLDALRSLRSLQSVPRGAEPVFVISCDEAILRSAVESSRNHPATAAERDGTGREAAGANDYEGGRRTPAGGRNGNRSEHGHPALAFVDKLLTARVQMPPAMGGDMRRFAESAVGDGHPLRAEAGVDVDRIVPILIHDGVSEPRSAIRLLNRFIAAYLLAKDREAGNDVAVGDITDYAEALAQLCVLLDEYPQFYAEIAENTVLLGASHKVALRGTNLTASERAALELSGEFRAVEDSGADPVFEFVRPSLRRFISGTAHRVSLPSDVGPLVYFMDTPGGRVLGARLRSEINSAVQSGDQLDLALVLGEVAEDQMGAAAGEIRERLHAASPVDASTYVSAVAPNLRLFEDSAMNVGDACADLLDRSAGADVSAEALTEIISHTGPGRHEFLCGLLVRQDEGEDAGIAGTNSRMVHAAEYMADNLHIRLLVEPAVTSWVEALPEAGGWDLAQTWLDAAEALDTAHFEDFRRQLASSLVQSVRSENGFSSDDADRLVSLSEAAIPGMASAAPDAAVLAADGANTRSAFVRLWDITGHEGSADSALLAAKAAADEEIDPDVRRLAIRQTVTWADEWTDVEWDTDEEEAEDGEVHEVIVGNLAGVVDEPRMLAEIAEVLPALAVKIGEQADHLLAEVARAAHEFADENPSAAETAATALLAAAEETGGTDHEGLADEHAGGLLDAIDTDQDPSAPAVQLALRLIPKAAPAEAGNRILGDRIRQWGQGIGIADTFRRTRIEGLRAVAAIDPQLIDDHAQAQSVFDQIDGYLRSTSQRAEPLRTVAAFPWPESLAERALATIKEFWGEMPPDAQLPALRLVHEIPEGAKNLAWAHNQLAQFVQAEPRGEASEIAAAEINWMAPEIRARVVGEAVGRHEAVTAAWADIGAEAAAEAIVDCRNSGAVTISRLLDALEVEQRPTIAAEALVGLAATDDATEEAVQAVAACCDNQGLAQAAETATRNLAEDGTAAASALRVIAAARENQADVDSADIQELAAAHLADSTAEIAELFGRAINRDSKSAALRSALKELRTGDSTAKSIEASFQDGTKAQAITEQTGA